MRIFATGANGKIGTRLQKMGVQPLDCDVTDLAAVEKAVEQAKPEVVIHLAGISDVDYCEAPENKEKVIKTNLRGTWNVALATCSVVHCIMVLLSSDHVFDGKKGPYDEKAQPKDPVNFYGMSKMAAEALRMEFKHMKIVRTSYLFNYNRLFHLLIDPVNFYGRAEFVTFMNRSFMYEGHFAENLYNYLLRFDMMPPILHISGSQTVSWYEFALAAASILKIEKSYILPRRKELKGLEYYDLAPRPKKAGLKTGLSSKFLRQYSYIDGLNVIRNEMPQ